MSISKWNGTSPGHNLHAVLVIGVTKKYQKNLTYRPGVGQASAGLTPWTRLSSFMRSSFRASCL